jgi:hypothetical protein
MTIAPDRLAELDALVLAKGAHSSWEEGACVMEAVAYVAGEPFSAHPKCASPVIAAFLRSWNDGLDDQTRQRLKPYIPRLVGTKGTKRQEEKRAWMATDCLAREYVPAFLRLAGLTEHAEALEGLAALTTTKRAEKAQPTLAAAGDAARAAARVATRDAARAAARAAAGDAARAAARVATRDAALAAAWAAAGAAAGVAARDAALAAAGDAARAAAGDAARAAARDAAWAAAGAAAGVAARDGAWAAAGVATHEALAPTVAVLQESAFDLLDRMIAVTEKA